VDEDEILAAERHDPHRVLGGVVVDADARSRGHSNDDAGHIIGNRLGGSGGSGGVFPQDPHVNRGAFRDHEAWVASQAANGPVDVAVTLNYTGASTRPSSVTYQTIVNGTTTTKTFPN
jgi:hypothetical protein